jgi:hypothetical protein
MFGRWGCCCISCVIIRRPCESSSSCFSFLFSLFDEMEGDDADFVNRAVAFLLVRSMVRLRSSTSSIEFHRSLPIRIG